MTVEAQALVAGQHFWLDGRLHLASAVTTNPFGSVRVQVGRGELLLSATLPVELYVPRGDDADVPMPAALRLATRLVANDVRESYPTMGNAEAIAHVRNTMTLDEVPRSMGATALVDDGTELAAAYRLILGGDDMVTAQLNLGKHIAEDFDPTSIRPSAEQIERNERLRPDADDRCDFCRRPMAAYDGSPAQIHLNGTNGNYFRVDLDLDDDDRSQGWFSVGPACAKKIPAPYVSIPKKVRA